MPTAYDVASGIALNRAIFERAARAFGLSEETVARYSAAIVVPRPDDATQSAAIMLHGFLMYDLFDEGDTFDSLASLCAHVSTALPPLLASVALSRLRDSLCDVLHTRVDLTTAARVFLWMQQNGVQFEGGGDPEDADFPKQCEGHRQGLWLDTVYTLAKAPSAAPTVLAGRTFLAMRTKDAVAAAISKLGIRGASYLFHGTSWQGAAHIVTHGISLQKRPFERAFQSYDYDDCAFYLTPSLDVALQYACEGRVPICYTGAVLVFKDFRDTLPAAAGEHLTMTVHSDTWIQSMVQSHHSSSILPCVKVASVITSPICGNGGELKAGRTRVPIANMDGECPQIEVVVRRDEAMHHLNEAFVGVIIIQRGTSPLL